MYETTQELNDRLEAHIRKYPEDWFWLHNRWKWTKKDIKPNKLKRHCFMKTVPF